jgi:hypothetical protein
LLLRDAVLPAQLAQATPKDFSLRLDMRHRDEILLLFVTRELTL